MTGISRRSLLKGAAVAAAILPTACERPAPPEAAKRAPYAFFNADEAKLIEAAVARLIPADEETGPGALEADVPLYIDRQLAGAWGAGAGMYRGGPWQPGNPQQGYQLPLTPAELFRTAIRAVDSNLRNTRGQPFAQLATADQDAYLTALEKGEQDLGGVPSQVFFQSLLEMTIEGFFADPIYGGNRDMVGWKLIGFPGAYANYYELVDQHGIAFRRPPMSLAESRYDVRTHSRGTRDGAE